MFRIALIFILILPVLCHASEREDFNAYKQQMQTGVQQQKEEYRAYTANMQREWKEYIADIRKNVGSLDLTSDKTWVNYSSDNKSKIALDNEKRMLTIEFVADEKAQGIKEAKMLIHELSKEINPFSRMPALTENVPLDKIRLEDAKPTGHISRGGAQVYRLTVPLNDDMQQNNEVQFAEAVRDMTEKYHVSYDLVMAIIKAESNFNVGAGSRKSALDIRNPELYENSPWGVMQVVPRRSGLEGWKRAKGKEHIPTADELLDPRINLEIGVAYLSTLQETHFDGVMDEKVRELVMIAAYRDGPEKVYAQFSPKAKKSEALAEINKLGFDGATGRLTGKASGSRVPDGQYVAKVERERNNYRVDENEKKEFEQMAEQIVSKPELRAAVNQWLGTPYRLGGASKSAVDCSGLTMNIYSQAFNMKIPRTTDGQYNTYGRSALDGHARQEGDLVYFNTLHNGKPVSHVGIWLDNERFVHASSSKGVIIANINETYYRTRYVGANRPAR